ncbi:hypothetical protein H257_02182 [Aphanomyces astaci]|uniref:WRKY19-like zinc finger domain-containing protein n=1 Tax=Aphanomyces astaci TaxID=112090 RepID=W4H7W0_APHAT|nr:hypothetical protein H257_02182 [Aphanomyces astaci]ETV87213.1 hypothetical protein H257_02182 [Aphanomyces astaci]|eukprot:XP_009824012.1 hypothetical protein H257_02182 [Aphanomyces astaci]
MNPTSAASHDTLLDDAPPSHCCLPSCRRYAKEASLCLIHHRLQHIASTAPRRSDEPVSTGQAWPFTSSASPRSSVSTHDTFSNTMMATALAPRSSSSSPQTSRNSRCRFHNCTSYARNGGLCTRHGGGRKCHIVHCTTPSQTGGLCRLHGGGTRCKSDGCAKFARVRGFCSMHYGNSVAVGAAAAATSASIDQGRHRIPLSKSPSTELR